jgi:MFS family permease
MGYVGWFYFGVLSTYLLSTGFPMTFGVFQDYYSTLPEFEGDTNIAVIGTVSTSIYFLGAPIATPLVKRYHRWQRHMTVVGSALCVLSLLAASFAKSVSGLIATQGVLYGTGFLMLYFPVLSMLNEWFVQRRGLAYGVLYAGSGFSGVGLPFLLQILLAKFGYQTTLRAVAVAQFALVAPILPLIKGRLPDPGNSAMRRIDFSFLYQPLFYCFALSNLFQGFAYYIPSLYLPSVASALGLSGTVGALTLSANNLAIVVGQVGFGYLSDRVHNVLILVFLSSFMSALAAFFIWGFAHSMEALLMFSLVYGWCAGGFVVLWQKFGTSVSEDPQPVFSLMAFGKGIGNIATGPVTAGLLSGPVTSGYGMGKFEPLILFLGSFMLCSSLGILGMPLKRRHTET